MGWARQAQRETLTLVKAVKRTRENAKVDGASKRQLASGPCVGDGACEHVLKLSPNTEKKRPGPARRACYTQFVVTSCFLGTIR